MINTIESLQGIYVALGGELTDVANITTIPEMLTAISTVAAAAARELPAVGKSDNGDVLTVVNGKWTKAAPTSEPFVVTVTATSESVTATKTYAEITAALLAGKSVLLNFVNEYSEEYYLKSCNNIPLGFSDNDYYSFNICWPGDGEIYSSSIKIYNSNDAGISQQVLQS